MTDTIQKTRPSRKMKALKCAQCGRDYVVPLSTYNYKIKNGQKIFVCSKRCASLIQWGFEWVGWVKTKTETEIEEYVYCPNCLTGGKDSQFLLSCRGCHKDFKKHEDIICLEEYKSGNRYSHYHLDCFKMKHASGGENDG